jgi:hypothetical protein
MLTINLKLHLRKHDHVIPPHVISLTSLNLLDRKVTLHRVGTAALANKQPSYYFFQLDLASGK